MYSIVVKIVGFSESKRFNESEIELCGALQAINTDTLIVTVNGSALLCGEIHSREAEYLIRNSAPMAAVRALNHKVGGNNATAPCGGNCRCELVVALAVCC